MLATRWPTGWLVVLRSKLAETPEIGIVCAGIALFSGLIRYEQRSDARMALVVARPDRAGKAASDRDAGRFARPPGHP